MEGQELFIHGYGYVTHLCYLRSWLQFLLAQSFSQVSQALSYDGLRKDTAQNQQPARDSSGDVKISGNSDEITRGLKFASFHSALAALV